MLADILKQAWQDVSPSLKAYKQEVDDLRAAPGEVVEDETIQTLHARLIESRRSQDRLEAIVADLGLVKSRCKTALAEAQAAYDDAWREKMLSTRIGEYTSAQERNATYAAAALKELMVLRKTQKMLTEVEEMYDYALFKYRGLDSSRRDVETRMRLLNIEGMLEH